MFPWKTFASHGLFHMCVKQTILPEIGVFRRVGCLSSSVNHGGISKNKDWSWGSVLFFSPRVLAIALSCFSISSLWSARAILKESGVCCQNPQHESPALRYIWRPFIGSLCHHDLIALFSVSELMLPFLFCSNHTGQHALLPACQDFMCSALVPLSGSLQHHLTTHFSLQMPAQSSYPLLTL